MTKSEQKFHIDSHKAAAEHCATLGKCFAKSSDAHAALAKSLKMTDPNASAAHEDLAECHKDAAASCAKAGQNHLDACSQLEQMHNDYGDGDSDMKAVLVELRKLTSAGSPTVSAIPRFDAPRLVPRDGQPTGRDRDAEKALKDAVDPALKDVIFDARQARG
jgi:hypothetical protein